MKVGRLKGRMERGRWKDGRRKKELEGLKE